MDITGPAELAFRGEMKSCGGREEEGGERGAGAGRREHSWRVVKMLSAEL